MLPRWLKEEVRGFKRNDILLIVSFILVSVTALFLVFLYRARIASSTNVVQTKGEEESQIRTDTTQVKSKDLINVLLLGFGGPGHDGGNLSDSIILVSINTKTKGVALISIPRDLWIALPVDYDNERNYKINAAFAIGMDELEFPNKRPEFRGNNGGGALAKYAVSKVVGFPVDYYLAVNFKAFVEAIDLVGGIEVNVPQAFDDYFYPIKGKENDLCGKSPEEVVALHGKYSGFQLEKQFTCRYEHLRFEKGPQEMDGKTALKFVRSRHSETYGGDFARSERQHAVMIGFLNKLISLDAVKQSNPLFNKLTEMVKTDIDKDLIVRLLKLVGNPSDYKIKSIFLNEGNVLVSSVGPAGQFILIPREGINKWEAVRSYISKNLALD